MPVLGYGMLAIIRTTAATNLALGNSGHRSIYPNERAPKIVKVLEIPLMSVHLTGSKILCSVLLRSLIALANLAATAPSAFL